MAIESISKATCDRCGKVHEAGEGRSHPDDWARVAVISPMNSAGAAAQVVLCYECRNSLRRWLTQSPARAA